MITKLDAPISVKIVYNHHQRSFVPKVIQWEGREYPVIKIGLHHTAREGRTLMHFFSVTTPNLFFRLKFNTDNLNWSVEEYSDGLTD